MSVKCEGLHGHLLRDVPEEVGGLTLRVERQKLLVTERLDVSSNEEAVELGTRNAMNLLRVLAASFSAYRIVDVTASQVGGGLSGNGKLTAEVSVTRSVGPEALRYADWDVWEPRLQAALDLFWQAQLTELAEVRFALDMATLELLARRERPNLLTSTLGEKKSTYLVRKVRKTIKEVVAEALAEKQVNWLVQRFSSTDAGSSLDELHEYLDTHAPEGFDGTPSASRQQIDDWRTARNQYLHAGVRPTVDLTAVNVLVGTCLRTEIGLSHPSVARAEGRGA